MLQGSPPVVMTDSLTCTAMMNAAMKLIVALAGALLTTHARADSMSAAKVFGRAPTLALATLSPDGAWLAYVHQQNGNQQVMLRSLSDGAERATLQVESK